MRDDIRKRIEAVRRGEVPEGYVSENHQLRPCDWRYEKIGKYLVAYDEYSNDTEQYELATSSRQGLMLQTDYYSDQRFDETAGGFHVVPEGYITYRHMSDDDIFKFNVNHLGAPVLVSPEYPVFTTADELHLGLLLEYLNDSAEFRAFCRAQKKGSTRTRMYFSRLGEFSMPIPSKAEQQRIAEILSACDRVIELKQKLVEELQQLKKTCLAKMFPQKGCTTPEIRFPGFTDPWEQRKVGEFTNVLSASRVHKDEWVTEGVPFFRSSDVVSAYKGTPNEKAFISESLYEELVKSSGKLEQNDILITGGGSIGIPYIVPNNDPLYSKDADLLWIKKSAVHDSRFLYAYFLSQSFRDYICSISHVGTIAHYTIEQVKDTTIFLPDMDEQKAVGSFFNSLDTLITLQRREIEEVQQKKKALMQLLLTGLVRVNA